MRLVGLTATAFRLDSGWLHKGKGKLFDDIVYEANVRDLIEQGYLCKLISKKTIQQLDVTNVGKRGGEFITSELEIAVDRDWITKAACKEIVEHGKSRRAWLVFCVTVDHAKHVRNELQSLGVDCEAVFGHTPRNERDALINWFRTGGFTCLVSVQVLGIGFNVPHVDMICLLRPTASGGLFVQQVGRGLRNAPGKQDCLVLDFAGNTMRHGPIDQVRGRTKGESEREGPKARVCPECDSIVPLGETICPHCGFELPVPERKLHLPTADAEREIVSSGSEAEWIEVHSGHYNEHVKFGAEGAPHTFRVTYYARPMSYSEWFCFDHPPQSFAYRKAAEWWKGRTCKPHLPVPSSVAEAVRRQAELMPVRRIQVRPEGKYSRVVRYDLKPAIEISAVANIEDTEEF